MSKLITRNEGDNAFLLEQDLLDVRRELKSTYWDVYTGIGTKVYDTHLEQTQDLVNLGKIACALHDVETALASIQSIPRS